jgi:DNA polymerase-1
MGDTIDNIKGVPGIGEKGALSLIATYGSLENLIANAAQVSNKRYREGLLGNVESAEQSRELARIRTDVPVEFDPPALKYSGGSRDKSFTIFNELAFRSLASEYAPTASTIAKAYRVVDTPEGLGELAGRLKAATQFALRVIPDCPAAMRAGIVGLAFSTAPREADYVPVARPASEPVLDLLGDAHEPSTALLPLAAVLEALGPVLADESIGKSGHDLKFDAIMLARHGIELRGVRIDTMIASYLIDASRSEHLLEDLALEHTSYKALSEEDICGKGAKAVSLGTLPVEAVVDYACERADLAGQLAPIVRTLLANDRLDEVYERLELPLVPVLVAIERAGVRVDGPALQAQSTRSSRSSPSGPRRSTSSRDTSSTSIRPSSSRRSCSTKCSCRF